MEKMDSLLNALMSVFEAPGMCGIAGGLKQLEETQKDSELMENWYRNLLDQYTLDPVEEPEPSNLCKESELLKWCEEASKKEKKNMSKQKAQSQPQPFGLAVGMGAGIPAKEMDWSKCKNLGQMLQDMYGMQESPASLSARRLGDGAQACSEPEKSKDPVSNYTMEVSPKIDRPDMIKRLDKASMMLLVAGMKKEDIKLTYNDLEVKIFNQDKLIYSIEAEFPIKGAHAKMENGYLTLTLDQVEDMVGTIE